MQLISSNSPYDDVSLQDGLVPIRKLFAAKVSAKCEIRDVPSDGDCVVHVVARIVARRLGRPTTLDEVRTILVMQMHRPEFTAELCCDARRDRDGSRDKLLAEFSEAGAFLPPILVARVVEHFAAASVRLRGTVTAGRGGEVTGFVDLYATDGATKFDLDFLHIDSMRHDVLVLPVYE